MTSTEAKKNVIAWEIGVLILKPLRVGPIDSGSGRYEYGQRLEAACDSDFYSIFHLVGLGLRNQHRSTSRVLRLVLGSIRRMHQ